MKCHGGESVGHAVHDHVSFPEKRQVHVLPRRFGHDGGIGSRYQPGTLGGYVLHLEGLALREDIGLNVLFHVAAGAGAVHGHVEVLLAERHGVSAVRKVCALCPDVICPEGELSDGTVVHVEIRDMSVPCVDVLRKEAVHVDERCGELAPAVDEQGGGARIVPYLDVVGCEGDAPVADVDAGAADGLLRVVPLGGLVAGFDLYGGDVEGGRRGGVYLDPRGGVTRPEGVFHALPRRVDVDCLAVVEVCAALPVAHVDVCRCRCLDEEGQDVLESGLHGIQHLLAAFGQIQPLVGSRAVHGQHPGESGRALVGADAAGDAAHVAEHTQRGVAEVAVDDEVSAAGLHGGHGEVDAVDALGDVGDVVHDAVVAACRRAVDGVGDAADCGVDLRDGMGLHDDGDVPAVHHLIVQQELHEEFLHDEGRAVVVERVGRRRQFALGHVDDCALSCLGLQVVDEQPDFDDAFGMARRVDNRLRAALVLDDRVFESDGEPAVSVHDGVLPDGLQSVGHGVPAGVALVAVLHDGECYLCSGQYVAHDASRVNVSAPAGCVPDGADGNDS